MLGFHNYDLVHLSMLLKDGQMLVPGTVCTQLLLLPQAGMSQVRMKLGQAEASATLGLAEGHRARGANGAHAMGQGWDRLRHSVESGVMHGFQLASAAGPLCDEPMWGIAFEVGTVVC